MLYRCNILYNNFFSLSIFYQLVRIAPRSSPRAAPAYVGIVILVGGGGGGGVVVAPATPADSRRRHRRRRRRRRTTAMGTMT